MTIRNRTVLVGSGQVITPGQMPSAKRANASHPELPAWFAVTCPFVSVWHPDVAHHKIVSFMCEYLKSSSVVESPPLGHEVAPLEWPGGRLRIAAASCLVAAVPTCRLLCSVGFGIPYPYRQISSESGPGARSAPLVADVWYPVRDRSPRSPSAQSSSGFGHDSNAADIDAGAGSELPCDGVSCCPHATQAAISAAAMIGPLR